MEWVFGIPEVVSKKVPGDSRCKYGLELVDRINEESIKFSSPILPGAAEERTRGMSDGESNLGLIA